MQKVIGRNAVLESLKSNEREFIRLYIREHTFGEKVQEIMDMASSKNVPTESISQKQFDSHYSPRSQGVVLVVGKRVFFPVLEMVKNARFNHEPPFILLLDRIQDVHNLGSIIRTAAAMGVHGIVIPRHNSAQITSEVERISEGMINRLMICESSNLKNEIKILKEEGVEIVGLKMDGKEDIKNFSIDENGIALILGNEAEGIKYGLLNECDTTLKIPMSEGVESLNVAVSFGIVAFKIKFLNKG